MYRLLAFLLIATGSTISAAQDASPIAISRVTLYTSGVGYFERTGVISGDSSTTLYFPIDQVNDVLKSLVLIDYGGGTIEPVTYGAQDPVSRQLKAFSIDLSDDPDEATLLDRLRGADVTVTFGGATPAQSVTGTIVGVQTKTIALPGQASTQESSVNLMTSDSLVSVPLDSVASLQITDLGLRKELKEALATVAEGRDNSKRPVTINFAAKGSRKVLVGYLTQTPLWQTSYRLVLGKAPYLQGWALVQNTSQEDWKDVSLSLVAGRPISFVQDLYTPVYVDRPVVQPEVIGSPTPQIYSSNVGINSITASMPLTAGFDAKIPAGAGGRYFANNLVDSYSFNGMAHGDNPAVAALPSVSNMATHNVAQVQGVSGAALGTSLFSYVIKVPVTIPRQKSAMIPFVGAEISAQRVSIYNSDTQSDHPLTGVRLHNTTGQHLMGGPVTVFDDDSAGGTAYVGDALIDDTETNQSRLISFAVDLAVDASRQDFGGSSKITQISAYKGILTTTVLNENKTVYTFKNNSNQDRTIVVEHPRGGGDEKLLEPSAPTERTADLYRFDLSLPAHGNKDLTVRLQSTIGQAWQITNISQDTINFYIKSDSGISQAMKDALTHISALRELVADTQAKISDNESKQSSISAGQDRIRKNMVVLDKNTTLYKRYADELNTQETQLNTLTDSHDTLETELSQRQNDLSDYIQNLTVN